MIVRVKPAHSKKGHMAAGLMSVAYVLFFDKNTFAVRAKPQVLVHWYQNLKFIRFRLPFSLEIPNN
ncbi:hypothetical protein M2105_003768 [Paenibacillus sp. PastF-1]|uniref:hypothetical protein n=1 Tax=Paenibacillus sp. PastF-1 TaxID=2940531 RepID=UPI0024060450|nr:hypothetical protein [Paenibacillus sp. PastF-1]MDF9842742.1 hypothetical protein [Paenibacillus sp. PastF-2]MDF9849390.1 hypothetical protein [Paenibacillus sp. PastM-2]MDH6481232.1 hypothetical protein [Paenibacillus sp. PastH-2]MDH6508651.1 hypothetical protein [Paenibacillus sp. PastM-3]MDF9855902.1 hypothetical protein [Paenibacillus sp. PastF-1]